MCCKSSTKQWRIPSLCALQTLAWSTVKECCNVIFSQYPPSSPIPQLCRSVNLRDERESCRSRQETRGHRGKETSHSCGIGRQRMRDSRSSEGTHLAWSSSVLVKVGNMFRKSLQSKRRVANVPMNMHLGISSMVSFVVWGVFFERCKQTEA